MEPKSECITATAKPESQEVLCPKCGMLLGFYICVEHQVWLQSGAVQAKAIHGRCCGCNTEFHFIASQKQLEHLIQRVLQMRKI